MTEYSLADEDTQWLKNLSRTGPGRQLEEHLKCVDYVIRNHNRFECPVEEACNFRRIFCHALAANDRVFGLPRPLPKYIAIVNLSGYRAIFYSSRNSLIRLLCMVGPLHSERVIRNVESVLQYASENNTSVLCCFSLPWQTGVGQVHWEVRTIERTGDCSVRDGVRSFSYTNEDVRTCASTIETDVCDAEQTKAQVLAMARNFSASNLDTSPDDIEIEDDSNSEKFRKLKAVVAAVQADRARLISEMDAIREDKARSLEEAELANHEKMLELAKQTKSVENTIRRRMEETEKHNKTLLEQNLALGALKAEAERAKAEFELLQEQQMNKVEAKAAMFEMSNKAASDKLLALQKTSQREREQLTRAHTKEVEDLERRLSNETVARRSAERRAEDLATELSKLNEVCETMRTEKQAVSFEALSMRKSRAVLKCALAVACKKHAGLQERFQQAESCSLELKQMLEQNESSASSVDLKMESLEKKLKDAEVRADEGSKDADQAKKKVVEIKKESTELKRQLAEAKKAATEASETVVVAETEAKKPLTASVEVNTEPQQEPEEVTKMRIEIAHLHDEKESLQQKLAQAAQAAQEAQKAQAVPTAPAGPAGHTNGLQAYTDLSATPCGDPAIEALVGQVQLSLKNLVDLARSGYTHKSAAEQLWHEVQVLKRCPSPEVVASGVQGGGMNVGMNTGMNGWNGYGVYADPSAQPQWFGVRR
jgi:hypothetical protein